MPKKTHHRTLRPRDYFRDPHEFGVLDSAVVHLPALGDLASQRAAVVQHRIALLLLVRATPGAGPGAALGRTFGFSRQHWSDCLSGRSWMRENTLLAAHALMLGLVDELEP
ncbi:hypothetical protein [Longivirga aurantiaca]|uniref:XRE family transcriptional regulator n=1 Tax=Longivirga aurantiaca TaxID=1837743 RepID=A0ABW1T183_9ACTN